MAAPAPPSPIDGARYPRLSRIQFPADLREFGEDELPAIADELRAYLIESVGKSGGHFGAGLGVIELTVALHYLSTASSGMSVTRPIRTRSSPAVATASTRSSRRTA